MASTETYDGSDCTGSDGDSSKVLTLANSRTTSSDGLFVIASGLVLHPTTDFTISHKNALSEITFVNALYDDQPILVIYNITGGTSETKLGSDCSGTDGGTSRVLTLSNSRITLDNGFIVVVSGSTLHPTTDFTLDHNDSSSTITFLNALYDDQPILVIYNVSGSEAGTPGASGILPLDTQAIHNELDYFGSTVTLRVVTDSSYTKWGDATESTSDTTGIKAMVQVLSQEDELVKESTFQSGDKVFWFKPDQGNIERGNRIYHSSKWYEINEVIEHTTGDITYILEARTKKI